MKVTFLSDEEWFMPDEIVRENVEYELHDMGLVFETPIKHVHRIDQIGTPDLLVLDWGGLSTQGAYDTSRWHVKAAMQWADANPGRLVIIWTSYTQSLYEDVIEDFSEGLDNVVPYYRNALEDPDPAIVAKIQSWFSV